MEFRVKIKAETFEMGNMSFLKRTSFQPDTTYMCVGTIDSKLLIADEVTGEFVELFPRNCIYIGH